MGLRNTTGPAPLGSLGAVDIPTIEVGDAARRVAAGAPLVDVRQPDEYDEIHAEGAVLVPLDEVPDRVEEIRADGPVYVICKSGGRSAKAVEFLRQQGVDAVNVAGGTLAWAEADLPTGTGER